MSFGRTREELNEIAERINERLREDARAGAQNVGTRPDERWSTEALEDAFKGREHELTKINELAARHKARQQINELVAHRRSSIRTKADAIEAQWRAQARAAAEEEATRLVGEQGPLPDLEELTARLLAEANAHAETHGRTTGR